ncbi:MAG: cytochrome c1 [Gammaproteobacteria bacterium]|nr:cytochrome c1 [Gammaproteobacteria bacterium]
MKRLGAFLFACVLAAPAFAKGGTAMHFEPDLSNRQSLLRGARTFVNYCLSCHSAAFMRYNRLGLDLDIPGEVLKANLMFGTDKPGETMTVAMNPSDAERWFGVAPPDLSVTARARGADWLYTYFMTFYRDPARPTGVNNLAFNDVAMPHVLWELQGWQRPVYREEGGGAQAVRVIDHLELESPGLLNEEQYEATVRDLVNFLVYLGEPIKLKRYTIGVWVILYLLILLGIVYLLKREYWSDVH